MLYPPSPCGLGAQVLFLFFFSSSPPPSSPPFSSSFRRARSPDFLNAKSPDFKVRMLACERQAGKRETRFGHSHGRPCDRPLSSGDSLASGRADSRFSTPLPGKRRRLPACAVHLGGCVSPQLSCSASSRGTKEQKTAEGLSKP